MHVFISHAGEDKKSERFRAIVHRLLDVLYGDDRMQPELRVGLWIDRPHEVSNDARLLDCARIASGDSWKETIETALARDDICILFFLSAFSLAKLKGIAAPATAGLEWELQRGQIAKRLVAVKLDGTDPTLLPERYRDIQFTDLSDYTDGDPRHHFHYVVDDIKEKLGLSRANPVEQLAAFRRRVMRPEAKPHDPFIAYRANRSEQCEVFQSALQKALSPSRSIRPLIFAGPEDEEPTELLERCFRESKRALGGEPCDKVLIPWPDYGDFASLYLRRLSGHFDTNPSPTRETVVQFLKGLKKPTVFYSFVLATQWSEAEPERIAAWLQHWTELSSAEGGLRAVPLLCLKFARCEDAAWRDCPPTPLGQPVANKRIWATVRAMCTSLREATALLPPLLSPLRHSHADDWLAEVRDELGIEARHLAQLKSAVAGLFDNPPLFWFLPPSGEKRVTMRRFASTINGLLNDEKVTAAP